MGLVTLIGGKYKTPNIQYLEFFSLLGVQTEVISKSVLKGVFLIEKRECRRRLKSLECGRNTWLVYSETSFNLPYPERTWFPLNIFR